MVFPCKNDSPSLHGEDALLHVELSGDVMR